MKNWKRRWALFLAAALLALSLTGCGGSGEGPALSVCVGGAPEELDPIYATETADQTLLVHLYENLMRKTGDGSGGTTVTNGAAKSVSTEENADGTVTWTFKLRKAEWSDGRAVRAGDFVFAWQRLADPANDSPSASLLSVVAGYDAVRETGDVSLLQVTAEDDSTLVVVLNGKFDWFLTEVCTAPATMPLRQDVVQRLKQEADAANENLKEDETPRRWWSDPTCLVTNGPYTASAEDENALTLTENTAYGKKLTGPEDLTFRFGDTQTAEVLYDQGVVDAVWPLTEDEMAEQMEADETWQAEPVLETYSVMFNCSRLEDESIRKALSLVIDREQLTAMAGITAQPAEGLVPPGVPEDNADLDFRACGGSLLDNDPESYADRCQDAVDLMQNAGYDRGSDLSAELGALEYLYVDQGSNKTVAMALCGMWGHYLGVNVTPRAVTPAELASAMRSGNYTLAGMSVSAVCSDAECFLMDWTTGNRDNFLHYENSAYDTLMSIIAGAEDGSARMGCLHDAEDLLLEIDCAISPLYTVGTAWKLRDTYLGAIRDPRGWFDFRGVYPKPVTVQ